MNTRATYHVVRENVNGDLVLKVLYKWAVEHQATEAFLRLLDDNLFGWGNPDMSLTLYFCAPSGMCYNSKRFSHDGGFEELDHGDVVILWSLIKKHRDYRSDQLCVFKWISSENEWKWHKEQRFYFARSFPFGGYTKAMPLEWGYKKDALPSY